MSDGASSGEQDGIQYTEHELRSLELMKRMRKELEQLKDDFIIAHLHPPCLVCRNYIPASKT